MVPPYARLPRSLEHKSVIITATLSPDAKYVATATADSELHVWTVEDGKLIRSAVGDTQTLSIIWSTTESGNVASCTFSPAHRSLDILGFLAHAGPVNCMAALESRIASGAGDELFVWQWRDQEPWDFVARLTLPATIMGEREDAEILVTGIAWTSNVHQKSQSLLIATYLHDGIIFYEVETWACLRVIAPTGMILSASLSANSELLAVLTLDSGYGVYSVTSQTRLRNFPYYGEGRVASSRFLENDRYLVCGSGRAEANVWDIRSGEEVQTLAHYKHDKVYVVDKQVSSTLSGDSYILSSVSDEINPYVVLWKKGYPAQRRRYAHPQLDLGLMHENDMLRATLTHRSDQASSLAQLVDCYRLDVEYYRDRCRLLEDELEKRLQGEPETLKALMPYRFRK
ncbi:WD40 repeat-like protein [Trametes sanguinea]|nr:WD40 repeat-like protein [Trametes sanguinea]